MLWVQAYNKGTGFGTMKMAKFSKMTSKRTPDCIDLLSGDYY